MLGLSWWQRGRSEVDRPQFKYIPRMLHWPIRFAIWKVGQEFKKYDFRFRAPLMIHYTQHLPSVAVVQAIFATPLTPLCHLLKTTPTWWVYIEPYYFSPNQLALLPNVTQCHVYLVYPMFVSCTDLFVLWWSFDAVFDQLMKMDLCGLTALWLWYCIVLPALQPCISAVGLHWHKEHFRCSRCNTDLSTGKGN